MSAFKHLFFDLDGTLTDSLEGIATSFRHALANMNVDWSGDNIRRYLGPPLAVSFADFFGDDQHAIDAAIAHYRQHYEAQGMTDGNRLYPGVIDMLEAFNDRGYSLSIVTSKPEYYARIIADHFDINRYFRQIYGGTFDNERIHKTDILNYALADQKAANNSVVMIGDRLYDMEAAIAAGTARAAVLYGYGDREELEAFAPLLLAETTNDLMTFFA